MATFATVNTTDKVLILDIREAFQRNHGFGTDWTELRLGMYFSIVPLVGDDAAATAETVITNTYLDIAAFGLKDSSSNAPLSAGSRFVGMIFGKPGADNYSHGANNVGGATIGTPYRVSIDGTSILSTTTSGSFSLNQYNVGTHAVMFLKLVVNNKGLSTQTISMDTGSTHGMTSVSSNDLRSYFSSYSSAGNSTVTWNAASAALPLPTHIYARIPTLNHRLRITTCGVLKVS